MTSNPKKILIMASKMEAEPFINGLNLDQVGKSPVPIFQNQDMGLVISGIGKTNAAMAATYSCMAFSPKFIFNLGAAGAVDPFLTLGDCFQVSQILEYDRPRLRSEGVYTHKPDMLPGITATTLATQDKPVFSPENRHELSGHVQLVDMEAASLVQVCKKFNVPCYVFKFVSDTPNHLQGNEIVANIKKYRDVFFAWFSEIVLPNT